MIYLFRKLITGNSIVINIFYAILYIFTISYVWKYYCVPVWWYFNYRDISHTLSYDIVGYFIALLPIFFYRGIKNVSSWISLILYYFGYVPIILSLLFNFPIDNDYSVIEYWVIICFFMSLYFYSDRIKIRTRPIKEKVPVFFFWVIAVLVILLQFSIYRNNMRLVGFGDIYKLRAENAELAGGIINYINSWSNTFIYPFIFLYGLFTKNKKLIIFGSISFIFLYSIFGSKSDLFSPIILLSLYYFFRWQERKGINLLSVFSLGIGLMTIVLLSNLDNETVYIVAAVFLMRTLTISGCLFSGYYLPFFYDHPHTYFSHINVVNAITNSNPYHGKAIGKVVSEGGMNANAIFWAMDGITGMGVIGVAIVSFFFLIFLIFLNSLTTKKNIRFVCMLMVIPTISLLNTSFFTFLLSEGVFLVVLTLLFVNIDKD